MLAVQAEETVVTAGAVVAAGVEAPGVVSWGVLQAGRQPQVLLVSQAALTPSLGGQPGPGPRLATVLSLCQHRQQLRVDQRGQRHAGGGGPQLGRGWDRGLQLPGIVSGEL